MGANQQNASTVPKPEIGPSDGLYQKFLFWLRLSNQYRVKLYRGFGTTTRLNVSGHVLKLSPLSRKYYRKNVFLNLFAVLRLFFVKPVVGVTVRLKNRPDITTQTDTDGFFRFEWSPESPISAGWQSVTVELITQNRGVIAEGEGRVCVPDSTKYGFISDIDDTFLISHSATIVKRLFVLLTENARSRRPFAGVVRHYQLLAEAQTDEHTANPFFYVSSSEWNLYDYILEFAGQNQLPEGIYQLAQLKRFSQILVTGKTNHATKLDRIARILTTFPDRQFVLLGDDTQKDPVIYSEVVTHYPGQIRCVYLRKLNPKNYQNTLARITEIEVAGVDCCYFEHSAEATEHSRRIGLI
jgi:phosphatidate phosphatase APP1